MFYWRKRGKVTTLLKYYPLRLPLSPQYLIGHKMRKRGKVAVVHILFPFVYSFFVASLFYFSSHYLIGDEKRKAGTEPLYLSEDFVEKFSEVFFRDDWIMN